MHWCRGRAVVGCDRPPRLARGLNRYRLRRSPVGALILSVRPRVTVRVLLPARRFDFDGDGMKSAVPYPALRDHGLSETRDGVGFSAKDDCLNTVIVIQMCMHSRNSHIVMIVLHAHQALGQLPLMVVVHVTEYTDAVLGHAFPDPRIADSGSQEVAEGL
jgi:hypothetical protein